MSSPELIRNIIPRALAHIWGPRQFQYSSSIWICEQGCGLKKREIEGRTEYWRAGEVTRMPPPCKEPVPA